jgi:ribose 5-phosphate isomerase B
VVFIIAIACDHGGFDLARAIKAHLAARGLEYRDFGTFERESCDYPAFAGPAARAVAGGACARGILVCGTGVGMSIAANKVRGVRSALCGDNFTAEMARRHNDANVLCLGARVIGEGAALTITDIFLDTPFDGGRHQRRVDMITQLETGD